MLPCLSTWVSLPLEINWKSVNIRQVIFGDDWDPSRLPLAAQKSVYAERPYLAKNSGLNRC